MSPNRTGLVAGILDQMGGQPVTRDYLAFFRESLTNPDAAFAEAMQAEDAVALACLGILGPPVNSAASQRLNSFLNHYAGDPRASSAVLALVELADDAGPNVAESVAEYLKKSAAKLPLDQPGKARILTIIQNREHPDIVRRRLLLWLWTADRTVGREESLRILDDKLEPPDSQVLDRALLNLSESPDDQTMTRLRAFAVEQFEPPPTDGFPRAPQVALSVTGYLAQTKHLDPQFSADVLAGCATTQFDFAAKAAELLGNLAPAGLELIITRVAAVDPAWLSATFIPHLLIANPVLAAQTSGANWWAEDARLRLSAHTWEVSGDDGLYVVALNQIQGTADEPAKVQVRESLASRLTVLEPGAKDRMPRTGFRELLRLVLDGAVATTDGTLAGPITHFGPDFFVETLSGIGWKRPERAAIVGALASTQILSAIPNLLVAALKIGPETALALVEAITTEAIATNLQDLITLTRDNERLLGVLCRKSPEAAVAALALWQNELDMVAFRALQGTDQQETRVQDIPKTVRDYSAISTGERTELLDALGSGQERVELLVDALGDRSAGQSPKPTTDDLALYIHRLGEDLALGVESERAIGALAEICERATQVPLRTAAYSSLALAPPTSNVLMLLLRRLEQDTSATRDAVRAALDAQAAKLDKHASAGAQHVRVEAASLLAQVKPEQAAIHARELVSADEPEDRILAAEILAVAGDAQVDSPLLLGQIEVEPSADARAALRRAQLRLTVGDIAGAHERLGEMAGISDEQWASLSPKRMYGEWSDAIVQGLERVARAEAQNEFGTAVDQLNEVAKGLLFRAITVQGEEVPIKDKDRAKAVANTLDYGTALGWQNIQQSWPWVKYLASLYQLRTEHIAPRGSTTPHEELVASDWTTAQTLFKRGAKGCLTLLVGATAETSTD